MSRQQNVPIVSPSQSPGAGARTAIPIAGQKAGVAVNIPGILLGENCKIGLGWGIVVSLPSARSCAEAAPVKIKAQKKSLGNAALVNIMHFVNLFVIIIILDARHACTNFVEKTQIYYYTPFLQEILSEFRFLKSAFIKVLPFSLKG